jgi:branched-chain amino acid transport system substrate-binding protein
MRRRSGPLAVLCGLALVASGCTSSGSDAPRGEIPIGVSIEQTGVGSVLGSAELNALNLVAEKVNQKGVLGKKIKLVVKDNKSDGAQAVTKVKGLIEEDKVVALIGGATSPTSLATVDLAEQRGVPMISMGAAETIISPIAQRQYIFKTPTNSAAIIDVLMRELIANNVKKVGILAVNNPYGDNGVKGVKAGTERTGVTITGIERFEETEKDYTAQITTLVRQKPDAIVVGATMPAAGIAALDIKDSGYTGRVYFDGGAGAELFVKGAGKAAERMFMVTSAILAANQITATTPSALSQKEFFTEYTQKYSTFSGYASYSADALNLLVEAIRKANSTDRKKIRDALESLSYDGLTGSYSFGPANHGGASGDGLAVLTVRNGGWVLAR